MDLAQPLRDFRIFVVDVETTGAAPSLGCRIIEVGGVIVWNGAIAGEVQQLVDPEEPISWRITQLTGITTEMVQGQPRFAQVAPGIADLGRSAIIVGHNIPFDLNFFKSEFRWAMMDYPWDDCIVLDTLRLARARFGRGGNSLGMLVQRLGVADDTHHRALSDARMTLGVLERLIEPLGGWDASVEAVLAACHRKRPRVEASP